MILSRSCVALPSSLSICASFTAPDSFAPSFCVADGALAAAGLDRDAVEDAACLLENADWVMEKCRKLLAAPAMRRDRGRTEEREVMKEHSWQTGASVLSILDLIIAVVYRVVDGEVENYVSLSCGWGCSGSPVPPVVAWLSGSAAPQLPTLDSDVSSAGRLLQSKHLSKIRKL